jgi:MFS family permease
MRVFMMTLALLHILLSSGEAYGWTALRPVLIRSGFFGAFNEAARTRKLNLVSTLGISANAMCKLPLGFILDRAGPRVTALLGSVFFIVGTLMMAWGDKQSVAQMAFAYFLLGTSGPFLQMPAFQFTNLFPSMKATLISLMITAFELSTGVFYLFNVANVKLALDHTQLFSIYAAVGVFTFFTSLFFWPDSPHVEPSNAPSPGDVEPARVNDHDKPATETEAEEEGGRPVVVGGRVPLIEQTFWRQVFSWEFAYVTFFFAVHNFTQGVVLTTTGMQVSHYFPDERTAEMMADLFSIILPMGFLPVLFCTLTGISGFILNRPQLAFLVVSLMSCTYGAMFLFPYIPCYLFLFAIFPVARQFVFSTFISYSATTFGYKSFGVLNGLASTIAGLVQLLQNVLVAMVVSDSVPFTWEEMDVLMSLVPTVLLIPPSIQLLRSLCCKPAHSNLSDPLLQGGDPNDPDYTGVGPAPVAIPGMPRSHSVASMAAGSYYGSLTMPAAGIPNFGSLSLSYGPKPFMLVGSFTSTADQDEHLLRSPPNGHSAAMIHHRTGGNS